MNTSYVSKSYSEAKDDVDEQFLDSLIEGTSELILDTKVDEHEKEESVVPHLHPVFVPAGV